MTSVNKVFLLGTLSQDPELKATTTGKNYVHVSLATNEQWTDTFGQKQQRTEWHHLELWGKSAELCCQYLKKGSRLHIEGSMRSEKYTDKEGVDRFVKKLSSSGCNSSTTNLKAPKHSTGKQEKNPNVSDRGC